MLTHDVPVGANFTWPKLLAPLAVIEPLWPEVRSWMITVKPLAVSCMSTVSSSPLSMNRSLAGSGVNVASVEFTGFAGACATPFLVMKAKLTYSRPACAWQVGFRNCPLTGFSDRLSMFSAAHHLVASQLAPGGHSTQPGG